MLNGLFWRLRSGRHWRDVPERDGPRPTIYGRFRRWSRDGTLGRIVKALPMRLDEGAASTGTASASAGRRSARAGSSAGGGFGTEVYLVVDGRGLRLAAEATAGRRHESTRFERVSDAVRVPRRVGRPCDRPANVAGDEGSRDARIRRWLRSLGLGATIPSGPIRRRGVAAGPRSSAPISIVAATWSSGA